MKYIKTSKKCIDKIKEYKGISLYFWNMKDIKVFYSKKEYKIYKKYKHLFDNVHIIVQKGKI